MPDQQPEEPPLLPDGGPAIPSPDIAEGARLRRARDTISIAIGKLEGWRYASQLDGAAEQYQELSEAIDHASEALLEIDRDDVTAERIQQLEQEYSTVIQETPELPAEVLDRYARTLPDQGGGYGSPE